MSLGTVLRAQAEQDYATWVHLYGYDCAATGHQFFAFQPAGAYDIGIPVTRNDYGKGRYADFAFISRLDK